MSELETIQLPSFDNKETKIHKRLKGFPCLIECEHAGRTFHSIFKEEEEVVEIKEKTEEEKKQEILNSKKRDHIDEDDFYGILELEKNYKSTQAEIKKAYKYACIKYHPGKIIFHF